MIDWIEDRIASILTIASTAYLMAKMRKTLIDSKKSNLEAEKLKLELRELRRKSKRGK